MTPCDRVLDALRGVTSGIDEAAVDGACDAILAAGKVVLYGCGREGLQLRGFAMRLFHMGFDVAMQGDMTTPPLGAGDLFIVSDGPGRLATVAALCGIAREAGARVLVMTAEPDSAIAQQADLLLPIPAQTMASDQTDTAQSALPMGSVYEGAMFVLFEVMVLHLKTKAQISPEAMRARHTNLE